MLSKDEELRLAGCLSTTRHDVETYTGESSEYARSELTNETILWLAEKLKEVNDELKSNTNCDGEERHRHWSQDHKDFFWHSHHHASRLRSFNEYHHHSPVEHRRDSASDNNLS